MEKTKLICCDIDDTLLAKDKSLPEANCKAIRKAVLEENIPFAILSGRSAPSVRDYMKQIGVQGVIPSLGGCLIEDWNGNILEENNIESAVALELYDLAKSMNCLFLAYYRDDWYIEPQNHYWEEYEYYAVKIKPIVTSVPPVLKKINPNKTLGVCQETSKLKQLQQAILQRYAGIVDCFLSSPNYLEIVPHGVNKGTAIDALCRHYGIKKDNVMAIGDYYNDVDMFKTAGISVAVNNAPDDIKAMTTYVTSADCSHGAVAEAIERFCIR